jgi:hypothetical protein
MPDDTIEPRIMASSTVRPTLVVAPALKQSSAHSPELTPGISTVEDVAGAVVGMTPKAARKLLEPRGFVVRVLSGDQGQQSQVLGSNAECANLTVVDGKVTHVAFG